MSMSMFDPDPGRAASAVAVALSGIREARGTKRRAPRAARRAMAALVTRISALASGQSIGGDIDFVASYVPSPSENNKETPPRPRPRCALRAVRCAPAPPTLGPWQFSRRASRALSAALSLRSSGIYVLCAPCSVALKKNRVSSCHASCSLPFLFSRSRSLALIRTEILWSYRPAVFLNRLSLSLRLSSRLSTPGMSLLPFGSEEEPETHDGTVRLPRILSPPHLSFSTSPLPPRLLPLNISLCLSLRNNVPAASRLTRWLAASLAAWRQDDWNQPRNIN